MFAASGLDIDDGAGVVVTDDGQIFVRVAVADFVDADSVQRLQAALVEQFIDTAIDDGGDRFPAAPHQCCHGGAVGALGQPEHCVFEVSGESGTRASPGHLFGDDAAARAVQAADVVDQP